MILFAQSASRPSTNKSSSKCQSSALQSHLNLNTRMCAVHSVDRPWEIIGTLCYSSTTTRGTLPYRCSQTSKPRPPPLPTSHFRPEWTQWDTRSSNSGAMMDGVNKTIRCSGMSSWPAVLHPSHGLHMPTIETVLRNK